MDTELLTLKMRSSELFSENEVIQWKERAQREGSSLQLLREAIDFLENRISLLMGTLQITEDHPLYKKLLMDGYQQLQEVGRQYRSEEAMLMRQAHEDSIATDREIAAHNIEQAHSQIAS